MSTISDLSKGNFVRYQGEVAKIENLEHRTPGNLRAFYQVKMRNLRTGKLVENRFRPDDTIDRLNVETKEHQFLYAEKNHIICMDNQTFEQIYLDKTLIKNELKYLKEGVVLTIVFDQDDTPISAEAPLHIALRVTYTEPGIAGDTTTRALKFATVETGAEIKVPLFIAINDTIKIKTSTGEYIERTK